MKIKRKLALSLLVIVTISLTACYNVKKMADGSYSIRPTDKTIMQYPAYYQAQQTNFNLGEFYWVEDLKCQGGNASCFPAHQPK